MSSLDQALGMTKSNFMAFTKYLRNMLNSMTFPGFQRWCKPSHWYCATQTSPPQCSRLVLNMLFICTGYIYMVYKSVTS